MKLSIFQQGHAFRQYLFRFLPEEYLTINFPNDSQVFLYNINK